ncbi:hypothetical protein Tco_1075671, partial [Tanacetum coccineum]
FGGVTSTSTDALLVKLLEKLGLNECGTNRSNVTASNNNNANPPTLPVAYNPTYNPTTMYYPTQPNSHMLPTPDQFIASPPGFTYPSAHPQPAQAQPATTPPTSFQVVGPAQQAQLAPPGFVTGTMVNSGHATTLPQAFTAGTLHDPTTGA